MKTFLVVTVTALCLFGHLVLATAPISRRIKIIADAVFEEPRSNWANFIEKHGVQNPTTEEILAGVVECLTNPTIKSEDTIKTIEKIVNVFSVKELRRDVLPKLRMKSSQVAELLEKRIYDKESSTKAPQIIINPPAPPTPASGSSAGSTTTTSDPSAEWTPLPLGFFAGSFVPSSDPSKFYADSVEYRVSVLADAICTSSHSGWIEYASARGVNRPNNDELFAGAVKCLAVPKYGSTEGSTIVGRVVEGFTTEELKEILSELEKQKPEVTAVFAKSIQAKEAIEKSALSGKSTESITDPVRRVKIIASAISEGSKDTWESAAEERGVTDVTVDEQLAAAVELLAPFTEQSPDASAAADKLVSIFTADTLNTDVLPKIKETNDKVAELLEQRIQAGIVREKPPTAVVPPPSAPKTDPVSQLRHQVRQEYERQKEMANKILADTI